DRVVAVSRSAGLVGPDFATPNTLAPPPYSGPSSGPDSGAARPGGKTRALAETPTEPTKSQRPTSPISRRPRAQSFNPRPAAAPPEPGHVAAVEVSAVTAGRPNPKRAQIVGLSLLSGAILMGIIYFVRLAVQTPEQPRATTTTTTATATATATP